MQGKGLSFAGTKQYRTIRLLGVGGMGAVYEVQDITSGESLALKVMLTQEPRQLLRFKQEFRVVAELHHPNLVRLFDLACEEEQWFFTMEFVQGVPLLEALGYEERPDQPTVNQRPQEAPTPDEILEAPPAPVKESGPSCDLARFVSMIGQVLDALEYLHARRIVHRDLKPSNIIVSEGDKVRLLDFGLASRVDRSIALSGEGTTVGTLAYMSPEQCEGSPATEASDLYALGCMMFQLLTGKLPFGGNAAQLIQSRLSRQPPRVERRVSGVPAAIAEICYQLLSKKPQQRPNISAIRKALGLPYSPALEAAEERPDFVGRKAERQALEASLDLALGGDISLAMVSGESGLGKSTLASVIAQRAQQLNFVCIRGRCYEREHLPFAALDRAVDSLILLLSQWPRDELAPLSTLIEHLSPIFPAISALLAPTRSKPSQTRSLDPRELSQRAFDSFCELLLQLQQKQPILLILDDLQWADRESITLLEALLSRQRGRIFILGLFRPEGSKDEQPLQRLLRLTQKGSRHTLLELSMLSATEATRVIQSTAGELDEVTTALLVQQTKGNPFLAVQMASYLSSIPPEERRARLQRETKEEWLTSLLGALSPKASQVLSVAAIAGGDISRSLLHETSALSNEDFNLALGELLSAKLCKALPSHDQQGPPLQRLDIYHDRLREAAYERLSAEQKRALHRDFALALEAKPRGKERDAELLLLHWTEAHDLQKQRLFTIEAAEQAIEKLAFQRAIQLFERLLEAPNEKLEDTLYRWERLGDLCEYSGQLRRASDAYQEALALWESQPSSPTQRAALLRLRGRVGENLLATGKILPGRDAYTAGLSMMGLQLQKPFLHQVATLFWLQCLLFFKKSFPGRQLRPTAFEEEQIKFFSQMIRAMIPLWPMQGMEASLRCQLLGMKFNDKQVLQRAMATKAALYTFLRRATPAQLQQTHHELDDAQKLADDYGLSFGSELVQLNRAMVFMHSDLSLAQQVNKTSQEGLSLGGMTEFYDGAVARMYYIIILFFKGDLDEALNAIERELEPEQTYFNNLLLSLGYKTHILVQLGRYQEAEAIHAKSDELLKGTPSCFLTFHSQLALGDLRFAQGHYLEAFDSIIKVLPQLQEAGIYNSIFYRCLWFEVLLNAAEGLARTKQLSAAQAKRATACAAELTKKGLFDYPCVGYRLLAILAHHQGKTQTANEHIQTALELSSTNANPYRRLLCLEAARFIGALPSPLEPEVTRLTKDLVRPTGWVKQ